MCRRQHLADACRAVLSDNGVDAGRFTVLCKQYTSLKLGSDVPVPCNVLVANHWDDGE